jgi:hypothetical protein
MNQAPLQEVALSFGATILPAGKTAMGIRVPEDVVDVLNSARRPGMHVRITGYTYRSTIAATGGSCMLSVRADARYKANGGARDDVEVALTLDAGARTVTVPPDFHEAGRAARDVHETLSYSNAKRFVLSIEGAKTGETRQRPSAEAVATLREERC